MPGPSPRPLEHPAPIHMTNQIGKHFIELPTVDSTNRYAAELMARGEAGHGTAILAHEQTAGKGQRGRVWRSTAGQDIALSVVLVPKDLPAQDQFILAQIAALAVHDVVADALRITVDGGASRVRIKWPNDVLIDRRKVAGILIENEIVSGSVAGTIIGVGINVNTHELDADLNATSLRIETGTAHDRMAIVTDLLARLQHYWDRWQAGDPQVRMRYVELLWARGRFTEFELNGEPFTGRPMDVDAGGRLLVEDDRGRVKAYDLDQLRFAPR